MATHDPWHFSRDAFALDLVKHLYMGLASRLTLVAPRRKGKTEFLLFDLAPAAGKAGYEVVYASLWGSVNAPQQSILDALRMAIEAKRERRSATSKVFAAAVSKVKVAAIGIGAEIELADKAARVSGDDLAAIDRAIEDLHIEQGGKLLLIFDEIQHLATDKAFAPLIYGLRTSLDRRRDIRVVFSGSSRGGIRRMFGDQKAPFFGFSSEVELPDLDQAFTDFLARTFLDVTGRTIDRGALLEQFMRLDRIPFYVREALTLMALEPALSLEDAMERLLNAIAEQNLISVVRRGQYQVEMPGFAEWLLGQEQPEQTQGSVG